MTIVRRSSPVGELLSLRQAMDRLFEDSFVRPPGWLALAGEANLPLDVRSTADALILEAALPGVRPDDVEITIDDGTLSIRAESRDERESSEGDFLVREIRRGTLARSLRLPAGIEPDKATASFEDGVLTLRIPKAEAVKPRQIRISSVNHDQTDRPAADPGAPSAGPDAEA